MTEFVVLLGPDYSGKSSVLRRLARDPAIAVVSYDDEYVAADFPVVSRLRRRWVQDVFQQREGRYSAELVLSLLQAIVLHLRDQVQRLDGAGTILVDCYYYRLLTKCVLNGVCDEATFRFWRSFPEPTRVLYLDVDPAEAWRRSGSGSDVHAFEHYGALNWANFARFQRDLRGLMLAEVGGLPVELIDGNADPATVLDDIRAAVIGHRAAAARRR